MAGCICDHSPVIIVDPPPTNICEDCLYVTSHIITADDGISPCGDTEEIEVTTNCTNPSYSIVYHDPAFTNVTISGAGLIEFESVEGLATPDAYYIIIYKVTCQGGEFEGYTVFGTAKVGIKNLCTGVNCDNDEVCDPCTGSCEPAEINLQLNIV